MRPQRSKASLSAVLVLLAALALAVAVPAAARAAAPGEFESLAASPAPLTSIAVDASTNIIYAQKNEGTNFYSYDASTGKWSELAEAPISSGNNGGAAYLNGKIYTSYTGDSEMLGVYDVATNSWSKVKNPLEAGTADITASGEDLYMAEGTAFISYDPVTQTTTKLASAPRWFNSEGGEGKGAYCEKGFERWGGLQAFRDRIYGDQGNECKGFATYDIATNTWTELPELPEGSVTGSAIDPISGTYFAYGPYEGTNFYRYDIATREWTTITAPFNEINDGGLAYVGLPSLHGVYAVQGQGRTEFKRYVTPEAQGEAELSLTDSPDVAETAVGADITYTVSVENAGPNEATNVLVSDPLPADVSLVSASPTRGSCSGTSIVSCDLGTLAGGVSATVTITVEATQAGVATNTPEVSSEEQDPHLANNSETATTSITTEANLSLTDAASTASATLGSQFSYTLRATNNGPSPATNVSLSDRLSSNVTLVSSAASQGKCSGIAEVICSLGTLTRGSSATVTITVEAAEAGTATDSAKVASEVRDPDLADNHASASTQITAQPALTQANSGGGPPPTNSSVAVTNTASPPSLKPPHLVVAGGVLRLVRGSRSVTAPLQNPNSQLALSGSIRLLTYLPSRGKKGPTLLASNSVDLAPGATRTLYLTLNAAALARLRVVHRLKVELVMALADPSGQAVKVSAVYLLEQSSAKRRGNPHKR